MNTGSRQKRSSGIIIALGNRKEDVLILTALCGKVVKALLKREEKQKQEKAQRMVGLVWYKRFYLQMLDRIISPSKEDRIVLQGLVSIFRESLQEMFELDRCFESEMNKGQYEVTKSAIVLLGKRLFVLERRYLHMRGNRSQAYAVLQGISRDLDVAMSMLEGMYTNTSHFR